jgi:hypothetical protein
MLRVIRRNVFETNSSSTHSLTMVSKKDYDKWRNGKMFFNDGVFFTLEEVIINLKNDKWFLKNNPNFNFEDEDAVSDAARDYEYYTYDSYWNDKNDEYETFTRTHKTESGEEVVAFGYYGYN